MYITQAIYNKYKQIDKKYIVTFISTIVIGLFAHAFIALNVIHNHDTINSTPNGVGAGLSSGRWVFQLIQDFSNKYGWHYNLPAFNCFLALIILSLCACFIISIYNIKDLIYCILTGGIFVTFPSVTSMMFFSYRVHYYSIAIFLIIFAVYLAKKGQIVIPVILLAISCGIYQAYFPLAITMILLLFLYEMITSPHSFTDNLVRGIKYVFILILGLVLYYIVLQFLLSVYKIELTDYQGINEMGIHLNEIPDILKNVYVTFFQLPFIEYWDINQSALTKICILFFYIISAALIAVSLHKKTKGVKLEIIVTAAMLPIAVNSILIMCAHGKFIYTLMVYSLVFLYLLPIILIEAFNNNCNKISHAKKLFIGIQNTVIALFLFLVIANYIYSSNGNYLSLYYANQQTIHYFQTMVTRIKSIDDYTDELPVLFIGETIEDASFDHSLYENAPFLYGGNVTSTYLINSYSSKTWFKPYFGYNPPQLTEQEKIDRISNNTVVMAMPCYPDDGSIKIIDDVIVVKLTEEANFTTSNRGN